MTAHPSPEQLQVLQDYAAGRLGTRETIEQAGLDDYADLIIALAHLGLDLPKPPSTPEHDARPYEVSPPQIERSYSPMDQTVQLQLPEQHSTGASDSYFPAMPLAPAADYHTALGYEQRWTSWVLALPEGREVAPQPLPEGYAVRAATDADLPAVHEVLEDAFLEWSEREREPFEDFLARSVQRPGHAPWMLQVVVDPDGVVVGACHVVLSQAGEAPEGYVNRIAVRRDRRGLGLARALLAESFAVARAHGAVRSGLSTDSRTGALGLYERVGMEVTATWVNLAARL